MVLSQAARFPFTWEIDISDSEYFLLEMTLYLVPSIIV